MVILCPSLCGTGTIGSACPFYPCSLNPGRSRRVSWRTSVDQHEWRVLTRGFVLFRYKCKEKWSNLKVILPLPKNTTSQPGKELSLLWISGANRTQHHPRFCLLDFGSHFNSLSRYLVLEILWLARAPWAGGDVSTSQESCTETESVAVIQFLLTCPCRLDNTGARSTGQDAANES